MQDKVKAAGNMIKKLRSKKSILVHSVEKLCDAYIDLAYHDVTAYKKERGPVKLPTTCPLLKLGKLKAVAMPTVEVPIDPTCRYDDIISIEGFDPCFQLAGGVNLPKVMSCLGSDGKRRRQLVKVRTVDGSLAFDTSTKQSAGWMSLTSHFYRNMYHVTKSVCLR